VALLKVRHPVVPVALEPVKPPQPGSLLASASQSSEYPVAIGSVGGEPLPVPNEAKLGISMDGRRDIPRVASIRAGSGAARAGMLRGDLILSVNGQAVPTATALVELIGQYFPGDELLLEIARDDETLQLTARLSRLSDLDPSLAEFHNFMGGELSQRRTGFPRVLSHDSPILPNQCGGPVVDSQGNFVGINIARASRTASYLLLSQDLLPLLPKFGTTGEATRMVNLQGE
jgi:serine protease Do